jgi:hypothetical protein
VRWSGTFVCPGRQAADRNGDDSTTLAKVKVRQAIFTMKVPGWFIQTRDTLPFENSRAEILGGTK